MSVSEAVDVFMERRLGARKPANKAGALVAALVLYSFFACGGGVGLPLSAGALLVMHYQVLLGPASAASPCKCVFLHKHARACTHAHTVAGW